MTAADCENLTPCKSQAGVAGSILRTLGDHGADRVSLEDFGCQGDGSTDDQLAVQIALNWSALNNRPVYASRSYLLSGILESGVKRGLLVNANATLIATPQARFIRGFGSDTNQGDGGFPLVFTQGDQPNIRIQGGLWNGIPGTNVGPAVADITFAAGSMNTISFTGVRSRYFSGGAPRADVLQQIWVYKRDVNGDYDPTVINNNRIFTVVNNATLGPNTIQVVETPATGPGSSSVAGMTASYLPFAGNAFNIDSTGGVIDGIGLLTPRGIQFALKGDGFLLTRSWSRDATPDAGGGVRFSRGRGMRGTLLDLETSDDCFQFTPASDQTVERSSYSDCIGRTNQGALIAFANGGGNTFTPDPSSGPSNDSNSLLRDCLARNIRGVTGGSDRVGVGIKMDCANPSHATTNCWVEDSFIGQSSRLDRVAPPCACVALA